MGKRARRVIGIAASIAVPFAAPKIAAAMGISGFMGTVGVGAAMGAGASRLAGGRLGKGALLGGLATGVNVGLQNMQAGSGFFGTGAETAQGAGLATAPAAAPSALGEALSGIGPQSGPMSPMVGAPMTAGNQIATAAGVAPMGGVPAAFSPISAGVTAVNTSGFMQTLRNIGGGIFSSVKDPQAAAQLVTMLGGALAGNSPADGLNQEQLRALQQLREQDERSYNFLMSAAQNLMSQANAIDPEQEGRMQAGLSQQRTARSALESGRAAALNPNNAAMDYGVRARQNEVLGQQASEAAFQGGFMNAQNRRANLIGQAGGLAPRGANTGAFSAGTALGAQLPGDDWWNAMGSTINTAGNAFGWWNRNKDEDQRGTSP